MNDKVVEQIKNFNKEDKCSKIKEIIDGNYQEWCNTISSSDFVDDIKNSEFATKVVEFAECCVDQGKNYIKQKEHNNAINDFGVAILLYKTVKSANSTEDINLDTKLVGAYINRGKAYVQKTEYDKAIEDFTSAIELAPNLAVVYNHRGNAYYELKKYEQAIQDYDKAIELAPNFAAAYNNRGIAYAQKTEHDKAIKDLTKAIELAPNFATAYNNRGNAYYELKKYEQAIKDLTKAIELAPNFATAYNNRGNAYYELKKYEQAIKDLTKAIELAPNFATAYNNRGNAYYELKKYEQAIQDYDTAIERARNFAAAYYHRGKAYAKTKKYEPAKKNFEIVKSLKTNDLHLKAKAGRLSKIIEESKDLIITVIEIDEEIDEKIDAIKKILRFDGETIVHYSSLKNIKKLLLERDVSFRISEANFMNDPSEGEKLLEILKLHSGKKNAPSQFHPKPFIGSFVHKTMNDELLLWRTYGKEEEHEGKGCSLSLNSEKFISEIKKKMKEVLKNKQDQDNKDGAPLLSSDTMVLHKPTDNIQAYELYRVAYINKSDEIIIPVQGKKKDKEEKESTKELDDILKEIKKKLKEIKKKLKDIEKSQKANAYAKEMLTEIQYLFKGEEYKHECEIRLIVPGEGIPKKIKESRVYIETIPIIQALEKITIGPTVEKKEEVHATFYYQLEEERKYYQLEEEKKPEIELSQHSFK